MLYLALDFPIDLAPLAVMGRNMFGQLTRSLLQMFTGETFVAIVSSEGAAFCVTPQQRRRVKLLVAVLTGLGEQAGVEL